MAAALFSQNPYLGLLVAAMRDGGGNWASAPVKGESYYEAEIETGRVGADQAKPKREF